MRTGRVVVLMVVVVACAAAMVFAQARGMGRIVGVVVDDTGAPVAGVDVKTVTSGGTPIECQTDATGKFTLGGIGRGDWVVTFAKAGYTPKRIKAIVEREIDRSDPIKITLAKGA
jgi:hypothetical protein